MLRQQQNPDVFYGGDMPVTQLSSRLQGFMADIRAQGGDGNTLEKVRRAALADMIQWRDEPGNTVVHHESDVTPYD